MRYKIKDGIKPEDFIKYGFKLEFGRFLVKEYTPSGNVCIYDTSERYLCFKVKNSSDTKYMVIHDMIKLFNDGLIEEEE